MFVVLLTNVQRVIPTATRKAATNKVLTNVTKAARAVTFCRETTSAWVCGDFVLCGVYNAESGIGTIARGENQAAWLGSITVHVV